MKFILVEKVDQVFDAALTAAARAGGNGRKSARATAKTRPGRKK